MTTSNAEFVSVPREPTEEMFCNGDEAILGCLNNHSAILDPVTPAQKCWNAMLAAAPSAPVVSGELHETIYDIAVRITGDQVVAQQIALAVALSTDGGKG